jgi:Flp pilus assembly protein TadG
MIARRPWRHIISCIRGSSALEFAFVAPIVFLAITGIIDFMMVMFVSALMEGGLLDASRLGRTGFVPATETREQAIRDRIASATIGLIDMSKVTINTTVYPCFDAIGEPEPYDDDHPANGTYDAGEVYTDVNGNGQWDPDMGSTGLGGPGSIVLYEVQYNWAALTPLIGHFFGPNGTIPLSVSVAVRNEPFGNPAAVVSGPAGTGTTGC